MQRDYPRWYYVAWTAASFIWSPVLSLVGLAYLFGWLP